MVISKKVAISIITIDIVLIIVALNGHEVSEAARCKATQPIPSIQFIEDNQNRLQAVVEQNNADDMFTYAGRYRTTGYCSCAKCCGKWAQDRTQGVKTASGAYAVAGRTVACNDFEFGTKLLIDGNVYTVDDRTASYISNTIDVYYASHQSAFNHGCQYKDVYIISS